MVFSRSSVLLCVCLLGGLCITVVNPSFLRRAFEYHQEVFLMRQYWPFGGVLLVAALVSSLLVGCAGKTTTDDGYMGDKAGPGDKGGGAQLMPMKAEGKA